MSSSEQRSAASTTLIGKRSLSDEVDKREKKKYCRSSTVVPGISNKGRVRNSLGFIHAGSNDVGDYKSLYCYGYRFLVHVLVALHFIGPPPADKPHIDHIDLNPSNNAVENLRYVSTAENNQNRKPTNIRKGKPVEAKRIEDDDTCWVLYDNFAKAAEILACRQGNISAVCQGRRKQHCGYHFRYPQSLTEVLVGEEFRKVGNTTIEVSNFGRLRDELKQIRQGQETAAGYHAIEIGGKTYQVHRLCASVFSDVIGQQPSKTHTIDHIDRNRQNNNITNLRWATPSQQNQNTSDRKTKVLKPVRARKVGQVEWTVYSSVSEASATLLLDLKTLRSVANKSGRCKTLRGYEFEYVPYKEMEDEDEIWMDIDIDLMLKYRRNALPPKEIPI